MPLSRRFAAITTADLIVRSAYQIGKTPLLPIFAAMLGATDIYLGLIVSVSTLTGMFLKPLVGLLSDRWGRRPWLLIGTGVFVLIPFFYWLVHTPEQLLLIRLLHGTATAIYGPVTIAYVLELSGKRRSESIGWFGMARNGGYILGPLLGGWLLLILEPQQVFAAMGLISLLALLPIVWLTDNQQRHSVQKESLRTQFSRTLIVTLRSSAIWLAGGLEAIMFIALYGVKAFVPLYGLTLGLNAAQIGLYFALQEGITIVLKPWFGRFGDGGHHFLAIIIGIVTIGLALLMVATVTSWPLLFLSAVLIGTGQALIAPNTIGLLFNQLHSRHLATGLGVIGALQNGSKVAGPLLAGTLIHWFEYKLAFQIIGSSLILLAVILIVGHTFVRFTPPIKQS
ncbi:MAG: MFS transporter [Chloroflexi bacterium]|nr:MFS transporter [Chloroflexota bacterium]